MTGTSSKLTAHQGWVLALSCVASFMVVLDMLVVATALSSIQADLHASLADLEWTVNAYTLSFAVLLMTSASLGDRYGRRRLFAAGLAVFSLASAACALSPTIGVLVAARTVQGVGAAVIVPLAVGLLGSAFPPERRGWALGLYGSITGIAAILGPIVGGALTQSLAWQWIFWLNLPIGLLAIPLVLTRLHEDYGRSAALDLPGLTLFTLAAVGLDWGLVRAEAAGWGSAEVVGTLAGGTLLLLAFLRRQATAAEPMIPLRLFRSRLFSVGNTTGFLISGALTGGIFFMTQYQQVALGQSPFGTGLRMLPWGIAPFLLAPRAGTLADRLGPRPLVITGMALQAAGLGWIALVATPHASYLAMVLPMSLSGIGFSVAVPSVVKAATSTADPQDIGKASGAYTTMRQLGATFGVAIPATVFATAAGSAPSAAQFSDGFRAAMAVVAALALSGAALGVLLPRHRRAAPAAVVAGAVTRAREEVADRS